MFPLVALGAWNLTRAKLKAEQRETKSLLDILVRDNNESIRLKICSKQRWLKSRALICGFFTIVILCAYIFVYSMTVVTISRSGTDNPASSVEQLPTTTQATTQSATQPIDSKALAARVATAKQLRAEDVENYPRLVLPFLFPAPLEARIKEEDGLQNVVDNDYEWLRDHLAGEWSRGVFVSNLCLFLLTLGALIFSVMTTTLINALPKLRVKWDEVAEAFCG